MATAPPQVSTDYYGVYLNGFKVGYAICSLDKSNPTGQSTYKKTWDLRLLPKSLKDISWKSDEFLDAQGACLAGSSTFVFSGGRSTFDYALKDRVLSGKVNFGGKPSSFKSAIPTDKFFDPDPLSVTPLVAGQTLQKSASGYTLSNMGAMPRMLTVKKSVQLKMAGTAQPAELVVVHESDSDRRIYCDAQGVILKAEFLDTFLIEREPKQVATSGIDEDIDASELGVALQVQGNLTTPDSLKRLQLEIVTDAWPAIPSDDHQTAKTTDEGFHLDIHPIPLDQEVGDTIARAKAAQPDWVKPDQKVQCDRSDFIALAQKIVGPETDTLKAAQRIQQYVHHWIHYTDGYGARDQRDAETVLKSRKGVCGDYAVLATTLLRAAGIPAKIDIGFVTFNQANGMFFRHGWVSIFDGKKWIGLDPTNYDHLGLSPGYLEVGSGSWQDCVQTAKTISPYPEISVLSSS
jgi:predicted transglutaminase-like cysteine proteinase